MNNTFQEAYKIAVDLGTTTIELAIIDGEGNIVSTDYFLNPQKLYGKDVINRINSANRDKAFIKIMKDMFIKSFKLSIMTILSDKVISYEAIKTICICGNTTMISILLEYDLEELGFYPYNHRLKRSIIIDSKEIFTEAFPINCQVVLSGCASAFIGGDVLSGLLAINNLYDLSYYKSYMFLDLGTNGEMILYYNNKYYTASCACGPAFESSTRYTNTYGSNLIDSIALGIKTGKISKDGILDDCFIENGIDIHGIHITSDILRDILLAKSAIRTGIDILLHEAGILSKDIEQIYIAGGFGFHLNIDNSIFIGLLPEAFKEKIKIIGNASLKGAIELLKTPNKIEFINNFNKGDVTLIQMANLPDYQQHLLENMNFKQ